QAVVDTPEEAIQAAKELGGPVVLKVLSRHIAHKSDVGGVKVELTENEIGSARPSMKQALAEPNLPEPEGFLVQKLIKGGVDLIIGVRRNPQLGTFILLGAGGTLAELTNDTPVRLLPIDECDAREMVADLKISRLLNGHRGEKAYDTPALVDAILSVAKMAENLGDRLLEAEVNPLFVLPEGQGVAAADGLVVLA